GQVDHAGPAFAKPVGGHPADHCSHDCEHYQVCEHREMDPVELLLHPVRLRIVHALSGGRTVTTAQLCARMPDVSQATVYRHVGLLTDAGILEVAGEQRVRGFVERSYRLVRD